MLRHGWVRYGCQRIHIFLRRKGLNLRTKCPCLHVTARHQHVRLEVSAVDQCWSMDFVADNLFNGRRIRTLTVVDNFSRECLAIQVGQGLHGEDVVAVMARLQQMKHRVPLWLQTDNCSEFISKSLDRWAYENKVTLDFSRPGKPTDNALVESLNNQMPEEFVWSLQKGPDR